MSAEPGATPVTGTLTVPTPAPKVTEAGTVATPVLSELRFTVSPVGGRADRINVRLFVVPGSMFTPAGKKLRVAVARTFWVTVSNPNAVAVTVANPKSPPNTLGVIFGAVWPAGMMKLMVFPPVPVNATFVASPLVSVTKTALPTGDPKTTGNGAEAPGSTVALAGSTIPLTTATLAVALATFGLLAVIVVEPGVTPVTGTATVVAFGGKPTLNGTVATPAFDDIRVTTSPPAGAGVDSVRVRFCVAVPPMVAVPDGKLNVAATGTAVTVTLAVVLATPGAPAVTVADPAPPPITGTATLFPFAGMVTVAGTVATPALSELRLIVRAVEVVPERLSVRFCVPVPAIVMLPEKPSAAVTFTGALAGEKLEFGADAVMVADPTPTPLICG